MKMTQEDFLASLKNTKKALLMLDYDGTLAPFNIERDKAFPYHGMEERIAKILSLGKTKVVIVSGRSIQNLLSLLNIKPLPEIWGSHGGERLSSGKIVQVSTPVSSITLSGLDLAKLKTAKEFDPKYCEEKPLSIAIHWRGASEPESKMLKAKALKVWKPFINSYALETIPFNCGIELRPKGMTKALAVNFFLENYPEITQVAYVGDDATDEEAFSALGGRGLKVLISNEKRKSKADIRLSSPEGLITFLDKWIQAQGN